MNNPELFDPVRLYAPWRTLLHESLQHGRLPYWDPYMFAGTPFLANSQAAIFYPPNLLYGITSVDIATTILLLAHVWIAAVGMYLLARYGGMRLGIPAAVLAATGFAFAGFAMVWFEFPTFISVYAWMPWSVLALWRLVSRPSAFNYVGLAATVGLGALGGHVQRCLDRLQAGDEVARKDLLNAACERLLRLTRKMLRADGRLKRWEQTDDVFQNAMLRLHRSLADVQR